MSTQSSSSSNLGSSMVKRFAASSFPPMKAPVMKHPLPKTKTSLDLSRGKRSQGYRPILASRRTRSYTQASLKLRQHGGGSHAASENTGTLHTSPSRNVSVTHRTVHRSDESQQPSHASASKPRPGIPWGQAPGVSGTRSGVISPIDSEGNAASQSSTMPKSHDDLMRAKLISKLLFSEAARVHNSFGQCFNYSMRGIPSGSANIGSNIRPRHGVPGVYDIHLVLRPPVPSEAFEIMSTLLRDIAPGHAVARLNPTLSPAEKVNVKKIWGPLLLADTYLTPSLVHQCITDGVGKAITSLDKIHIAHDLYSIIPSASSPPEMTLMVTYINMDTTVEETNSSFTINIYPAIIAAGIPRISGFQLRMPMPRMLPYSRVGLEIMREFDREVQDWTLFWRLEGRYASATFEKAEHKEMSQDYWDFDIMLTKRKQMKKEKQESDLRAPLPIEEHMRSWVISFEPLEERLLELCLQNRFFAKMKEAYALFDDMVMEFSEEWSVFPPALTTSLKLWTMYKTANKNRTVRDWLRSLLRMIHESLKEQSCAYFLLPRINMLQHIDKKHIESLRKKLQRLLQTKSKEA